MSLAARSCLLALPAAAAIFLSTPAHAAGPDQDPSAVTEARSRFGEGMTQYRAERYEAALEAFERSNALVRSPNTLLLIARCLRELGRRPAAAAAFAETERLARERVIAGETKYEQTAEAAAKDGADLRAHLATLRVHVDGQGATLEIDGAPVALAPGGDATVLHDPGKVVVRVRRQDGADETQSATLAEGGKAELSFRPGTAARPESPVGAAPSRSWAFPATLAAAGVTVIGAGLFIGFGLQANAAYDELAQRCGPSSCGPKDRADADAGVRDQTVANVGLAVGVAGLVATAVFSYLWLSGKDRAKSTAIASSAIAF